MDQTNEIMDVFLQPGEYFVGDADCRIRTLLGSCVSVTLWHPLKRIGGMSHFLLARRHRHANVELDGRYGEEAMQLLMRDLAKAGASPAQCEAKIFGGGNMFPDHHAESHMNVGRKNGEAARRMLHIHHIPIVSESLFGVGHRQIIFDIATGDVWSRQIKPVNATEVSAIGGSA